MATSGTYIQFFDFGGRRYHHIMDPITAAPRVTSIHSLSVTAPSCMAADVACGTVYGLPTTDANRILARLAADTRVIDTEI